MVGSEFYHEKNSKTYTTTYRYQDIDGVMWPSHIVMEFGNRQEMEVTEIELDVDVDDIDFSPHVPEVEQDDDENQ